MTTVVLVRTPLSVVCAREALDVLGCDMTESHLLIFDHPRPAARRQLWTSLEETGLLDEADTVTLVPPVSPGSGMARLARTARSIQGPVDDLIIGSYVLGSFRYLMDLLEPRRVVLVDDGAQTLMVMRRRADWIEAGRPTTHLRWSADTTLESPIDRERARVGRGLARLRLHPGYYADVAREPDSLTVCTYLEMPSSTTDAVARHSFDWVRSQLAEAPRSSDTLFLGSPLIRTNKVAREDYLDYLERARDSLGPFTYVAHRQERPQDLRDVEGRIDVTVVQPSWCIELGIGREFAVPTRVVAPWSSALESLAVLLRDMSTVSCLPLPLERFTKPARMRARRRYAQLEALHTIPIDLLD